MIGVNCFIGFGSCVWDYIVVGDDMFVVMGLVVMVLCLQGLLFKGVLVKLWGQMGLFGLSVCGVGVFISD